MTPHGSRMFRYSNFGGGVCVAATTRWLQTCRTNNFTIRPGPDHQVLASQQHYETVQLLQRLEDSVNIDYYAILARAGFNVIRSVSTPNNEGSWGAQLTLPAECVPHNSLVLGDIKLRSRRGVGMW